MKILTHLNVNLRYLMTFQSYENTDNLTGFLFLIYV